MLSMPVSRLFFKWLKTGDLRNPRSDGIEFLQSIIDHDDDADLLFNLTNPVRHGKKLLYGFYVFIPDILFFKVSLQNEKFTIQIHNF